MSTLRSGRLFPTPRHFEETGGWLPKRQSPRTRLLSGYSGRTLRQALESRLADLKRVDYQPVDLEAATADALAYLGRFREVLEIGTLEQRKEFLRGFVHEIRIDPDAGRGVITFYELPAGSLMMVPGARVALLRTIRSSRLDGFALPEESWKVAA